MRFVIDQAKLRSEARRVEGLMLRAGVRAIRDTTRELEKDLEAAAQRSIPGKLHLAFASETFPTRDVPARNPRGDIYVNGRERTSAAIKYWTTPGTNRPKDGGYLAVPTDRAGGRGAKRNLTPRQWEQRTGQKLQFVPSRGRRPAMLVARQLRSSTGRGFVPATPGRSRLKRYAGRREQTRVIFWLIRDQQHANTVPLDAIARTAKQNKLPAAVRRHAREINR